MKRVKIISVIICIAACTALFGCGNGNGGENTTSPAAPSQSDEKTSGDEFNVKNALEEATRLTEAQKNQVLASNQSELDAALADKTSSGALFRTTERTSVTVSGAKAGKTVTVKAPSASVISESEGVSFILEETGTGGLITDAEAASIYVRGDKIPLTLKSGAESIVVYGSDCSVTFKGGKFGTVAVFNATAVLTNLTAEEIAVTLANGTTLTLPSMQTYSFNDGKFSKAKA